jgi:hypothetical protein
VLTETAHVAAIRDTLTDALGQWSAYDYDDVPDKLPALYALVTVTKRAGAPVYMCGGKATTGYRLTTLAVGRTVDEARWVRDIIAATIEDQALDVAGTPSTRVRLESEQPIEPDDGRYSGLTTWTYAL